MRRRTARNRSTTPPPDTGLPAAPSCGRGVIRCRHRAVSEAVYSASQTARCRTRHTTPATRHTPESGSPPSPSAPTGARYPRPAAQHRPYSTGKVAWESVTICSMRPCTGSGAPRGSRILPRPCDLLRILSPFGGAPRHRFRSVVPPPASIPAGSTPGSALDRPPPRPAATISVGDPRFPAHIQRRGRPVFRSAASYAQLLAGWGPAFPGPPSFSAPGGG